MRPSTTSVAEQLRELSGGGVDRIVEVDIAVNAVLDMEVLRSGGDCVIYGSGAAQFELGFFPLIIKNIALRFFIVYNLGDEDRRLAQAVLGGWLARGALQHNIARRLPLASIAQAHDLVGHGGVSGNVVLSID